MEATFEAEIAGGELTTGPQSPMPATLVKTS